MVAFTYIDMLILFTPKCKLQRSVLFLTIASLKYPTSTRINAVEDNTCMYNVSKYRQL